MSDSVSKIKFDLKTVAFLIVFLMTTFGSIAGVYVSMNSRLTAIETKLGYVVASERVSTLEGKVENQEKLLNEIIPTITKLDKTLTKMDAIFEYVIDKTDGLNNASYNQKGD